MKSFTYESGEEIKAGDEITFHGDPGKVEFVVTGKIGDPTADWYVDEFPGGGFMITASGFGHVFLTGEDPDEDLVFVSRA